MNKVNHTTREICKICYKPNKIGFDVPNKIWIDTVPKSLQNGVICISCFSDLADEKLIDWSSDINLYPVSFISHLRNK